MPRLGRWADFPKAIQRHLLDRLDDRSIGMADLALLQQWVESCPVVPEGEWFKDFGSFKLCGAGPFPKTFLLKGQIAKGEKL
jgi:hypothetical protein